ncbi:OmpA family protein [Marivita sp. S0852]|uniref:OmpA family protein n=1 Tax=Marivita sp. S0852 TaxID=3373893 RepID=UPI00398233C1
MTAKGRSNRSVNPTTKALRSAGVSLARASYTPATFGRKKLVALITGSAVIIGAGVTVAAWAFLHEPTGGAINAPGLASNGIVQTDPSIIEANAEMLELAETRRNQLEAAATRAEDKLQAVETRLAELQMQQAETERLANLIPAQTQPTAPVPVCVSELKSLAADLRVMFPVGAVQPSGPVMDNVAILAIAAQYCPDATIVVEGHTDASGDDTRNMQISWSRADNTIAWLRDEGYDTTNFRAVGFGSRAPLSEGDADEDADRRVEFNVQLKAQGQN